jgi:hypothetical protein
MGDKKNNGIALENISTANYFVKICDYSVKGR